MNIKKAMSTNITEEKIISIYNKYYTTMYKAAYAITKNKSNAEDAVQEAFISIIKNINSFDDVDSESTKTLICIIQRNKAIDLLRKQNRYQELTDDEINNIVCNNSYDAEKNLYDNYLSEVVRQALSKIQPQYQHVLILHYLQNRTVKEISRLLEKPSKTIYTWLSRGKNELSSILKMQEFDYEKLKKK